MVVRILSLVLLSATLVGCAAGPRATPVAHVQPSGSHALNVEFSSDVPERYYVVTGPAQSYESLRFNDDFRAALEEYARRKSAPGGRPATLRVHLLGVSTSYKEIGAPMGDGRHARVSFLMRELTGDPSAPEELTKGVTVVFRLSLETAEGGRGARDLRADVTEVIDRYHFDRWSYDYSEVLDAAIRKSVETVDATVSEFLR
jgi:hypothetical protein